MKKEYLKPCAEVVDFVINVPIMDEVINPGWSTGYTDEEGI